MARKSLNGVTWVSIDEPQFEATPAFGGTYKGQVWEIDRSEDGRRIVALFEQSGEVEYEYPCDEIFFVLEGTCTLRFEDGQEAHFKPRDVVHFPKGTKGTFIVDKFLDLAVLTSDDGPNDII
jgi:uncharacterized cupin superfamily protein